MKTYFKIGGIDHDRYVGIAKNDGKAYDFYILNIGGYRPAETQEEIEDCEKAGKTYYQDCKKISPFRLFFMSENEMEREMEEYLMNIGD